MSATRDVTFWCDGVEPDGGECGVWHMGHDAKEARAELAKPGKGKWLTGLPGGRDLCPAHADQRNDDHRIGDHGRTSA